MPPDFAGLLAPGTVVELPGGVLEEKAAILVQGGLAAMTPRTFVRCCNLGDADIAFAVDRTCSARVFVPDDDYEPAWCPRCDRRLEPARKQKFEALMLEPNLRAIWARVECMLALPAREHPDGVLRLERDGCEAAVVFLDVCEPRIATALLEQGAIGIAADYGRFSWRVSRGAPLLSAAELVLGSPLPLQEAVRAALSGAPRAVVAPPAPSAEVHRPAPVFPLPPGAGWGDVTVYFVDGATLGICVPGARPVHASAVELGLAKESSRMPTKRFALLAHLCLHRGRTDWRRARESDTHPVVFDNFAAFKMQATELRRDLQRIFGRGDDPFASFGEHKPLVTAFRAIAEAPGRVDYVRRIA